MITLLTFSYSVVCCHGFRFSYNRYLGLMRIIPTRVNTVTEISLHCGGPHILYIHYDVENPLCSSYPTICGWVATVKKGRKGGVVSPPTGCAPCLVASTQGASGDLTTCAPVYPWLPGWTPHYRYHKINSYWRLEINTINNYFANVFLHALYSIILERGDL